MVPESAPALPNRKETSEMIKYLFSLYRKSPFWLRNVIGYLTFPVKAVMFPFSSIYIGGYRMYLDYRDNASFKYFSDREKYELAEITAFLKAIIYNRETYVVDIGANYGAFSLAAANLCRFGLIKKVIAIEPDLRPYSALKKSLSKNCFYDVDLYNLIIGDTSSAEKIFINARSSADNRTHNITTAPIRIQTFYEVNSVTLDQLLSQAGIEYESFFVIKMDIQGNEPRAIKGMKSTLSNAKGFILFFEHAPYLIESACIDDEEYINNLKSLEADYIYEICGGSIVHLPSFSDLSIKLRQLKLQTETRMQGSVSDFVLVKNMNFPVN
jgi:FkbM family methyltransferase